MELFWTTLSDTSMVLPATMKVRTPTASNLVRAVTAVTVAVTHQASNQTFRLPVLVSRTAHKLANTLVRLCY